MKRNISICLMLFAILSIISVVFSCSTTIKKQNEESSPAASTTVDPKQQIDFDSIDWNEPEFMKDEPKCCYVQCIYTSCYAIKSPCSCTCFSNGYANCTQGGNGGDGGEANKSGETPASLVFVSDSKLQSQSDLYHYLLEQINRPDAARLVFLMRELFIDNDNVLNTSHAIDAYYEYASAYEDIFITFTPEDQNLLLRLGINQE